MADKTQDNLARVRACDADWNENDHPRADNGQFTSGSGGGGAKVSKATPDMKKGKHKYGNRQGFGKPAEEAARNEKKAKLRAKSDDLTTRVAGEGNAKTAKERRRVLSAAKATLEKARPRIAAMRELAKAAQPDIKGMEAAIDKKKSELKTAIKKQLPVDQIKKIREDLDQMKFDYRAARFPRQYGSKAAAPAAKPAQAGGSNQQSAEKFTKVADNLKKVDSTAAKYARQMSKVAAKSGEAAALKWAENMRAKIEADRDLLPIEKGYLGGRLNIVLKEYNKSAGNQAPQPAPQPTPAPTPNPSKKSDVGQKGIDYLRSISHVNSSFEENAGYTARNMIDMINQGKTLKEIRSEMRSNIMKHSPDIDGDLQHLDSIIAKVKKAQQ